MKRKQSTVATGFAAIAVILATFLGLNSASAATIGLEGNNLLTGAKAVACAKTTLSVTVNATKHLQVSNIQPACYGRKMTAKVISAYAPSAVLASGVVNKDTVAFTSALAVDTVDSVQAVKIVIDGWSIPAVWTWTNPNPIVPNKTTAGVSVSVSMKTTETTLVAAISCATVTVTSSSITDLPWKADVIIAHPLLKNDKIASNYKFTPAVYNFVSPTVQDGRFVIEGKTPATDTVSSSKPRQFQMCL